MGSNPPGGPNQPGTTPYDATIPQSGIGTPSPVDALSNSSILSGIEGQIPGADFILGLVKDMANLPTILLGLLNQAEKQHPIQVIEALSEHFATGLRHLKVDPGAIWQHFTDLTVGQFYTDMLRIGLEVEPNDFDDNAAKGVKVVDTMLGFTFILQYAVAALETFSTGLFAGRWSKALKHTVAHIPEEMGVSWVMGTILEQAFESAVGESIREGINRQKRGNRVAWQQLRVLLKQHILTEEQLVDLLKNQGFPDEQIEWLKKLADITIPVGDISQLYYREVIDEKQALALIEELGFNKRDANHVLELYVTKAETQASVTYRSIAKQMYVNHLIQADQYTAILKESNFPKRMIDADIAGITLEQTVGHLLETVALVKSEYQHKQIDASEAQRRLALLNYAPSYITELIASWEQPSMKAKHGLSTAKVLSYMISGLITPENARPMLQANGINEATVEFLLLHPSANGKTVQHKFTTGLVTQAYMDGAISQTDLPAMYERAGVPKADVDYYVKIALYKSSHKRGNVGYTQHLTAGEWKQAYKVGLIDFPSLVQAIESEGYDPTSALILAEIENKGPYQPPQAPLFATVGEALAYIRTAGYTITAPPDPKLQAAENMAAVAGYSWTKPYTPNPVLPPPVSGGGVPQGTQ